MACASLWLHILGDVIGGSGRAFLVGATCPPATGRAGAMSTKTARQPINSSTQIGSSRLSLSPLGESNIP
jgi:hypothetical protein